MLVLILWPNKWVIGLPQVSPDNFSVDHNKRVKSDDRAKHTSHVWKMLPLVLWREARCKQFPGKRGRQADKQTLSTSDRCRLVERGAPWEASMASELLNTTAFRRANNKQGHSAQEQHKQRHSVRGVHYFNFNTTASTRVNNKQGALSTSRDTPWEGCMASELL